MICATSMTGPSRAARRPQADPAREAPTGAECKPVERAGQAQPDRKVTSESDFGKVPLSRQFTGVTFRWCIKTAPKSRAGLSTKTAAKLAFLGLKKGHHFVATSTTECSRFERVRDQKTSVFHAAQFCVTTRGAKTLYRTSLFISSKAVDRECIGPAFSPPG